MDGNATQDTNLSISETRILLGVDVNKISLPASELRCAILDGEAYRFFGEDGATRGPLDNEGIVPLQQRQLK